MPSSPLSGSVGLFSGWDIEKSVRQYGAERKSMESYSLAENDDMMHDVRCTLWAQKRTVQSYSNEVILRPVSPDSSPCHVVTSHLLHRHGSPLPTSTSLLPHPPLPTSRGSTPSPFPRCASRLSPPLFFANSLLSFPIAFLTASWLPAFQRLPPTQATSFSNSFALIWPCPTLHISAVSSYIFLPCRN
jgi:hypothetical protein